MGIVKDNLYRFASGSWLRFFKKQPIFPYYHIVRDENVRHIENLYPYKNAQQFRRDIDFLLQHYKPLNPAELLTGKPTENSFLLTFDDGLEEVYSVIYPILKEKGISAIFFVNPNFIDNRQSLYKHDISLIISELKAKGFDAEKMNEVGKLLSFDFKSNEEFITKLKDVKFSEKDKIKEVLNIFGIDLKAYLQTQKPYMSMENIREMLDNGFYFGGHTMSHPPLNQLTLGEQKAEIIDSIEWLKSNFGISYSMFAFPFSDKSASKKLLRELFEYNDKLLLFGNSGLKKDIDNRIIQRFSFENPNKITAKLVVAEHLYKGFNKLTGKYHIKRHD